MSPNHPIRAFWEREKDRYKSWIRDYEAFVRMRGFTTEINDWPFVRRSFIECWAAPGFHRFWQVWNPGIAYFVYRLFICLGGRKRWIVPTLLSFALCGVAHTVIVAPFLGRWGFSVIVAFCCFGVLTVISRFGASFLKQECWPAIVNVAVNVTLVCGSFDVGFRVDKFLGY